MARAKRYGRSIPVKSEYEKPAVEKAEEEPIEIPIQETVAAEPVVEETKRVPVYGDWPRSHDAYCEICMVKIYFGKQPYQHLGALRYRCHKHFV